jgi:hypothetical protein
MQQVGGATKGKKCLGASTPHECPSKNKATQPMASHTTSATVHVRTHSAGVLQRPLIVSASHLLLRMHVASHMRPCTYALLQGA